MSLVYETEASPLIEVPEMARALGMSLTGVRLWLRAGKIPCQTIKNGSRARYIVHRDAFYRWLREGQERPQTDTEQLAQALEEAVYRGVQRALAELQWRPSFSRGEIHLAPGRLSRTG